MKILFVINSSENGGAAKMIVALFLETVKKYPDSRLIFLSRINSQYSNIENAYYLSERLPSKFEYYHLYQRLYKVVKVERPNALISFLPLANILSGIVGKALNIPVRIASQRNPPQIYGTVVRFVDRLIGSMGFYTANVCNSSAGMDAFAAYPRSYRRLLSVINNSVEPANLDVSQYAARESLGIPQNITIIACVGRLHEQKNHAVLVEAMNSVQNSILYCAGEGPLREDIEALIKKMGVENKVVLMGDLERDQVRSLLRAADIFVIPSKYEGLSNSLIEAMSFGLPVVFSNIPSFTSFLKLKNLTDDDYAGILLEDHPHEWSKGLNLLINDLKLRNELSKRSLEKVSDLTPEKMCSKFLDLVV